MWSCCCNRVEIPESWFQRSLLHHIRLTIGFFSITGRPVPLKSLLDNKPVNSNSYPLSSISLDRTRSIGLCLSFEGQLNNCYLFVHIEIDLLCFRFKVINLMIVKCRHPQAQEFSACYISDAWFYVATSFAIFWLECAIEDHGVKKLAFLQRAQCSHCKRCISYTNSVCPSVCPSVRHTPVLYQNDDT